MRTILISVVLAIAACACDAQWVQTNAPGLIMSATAFGAAGTHLFAGIPGAGVFLSTDDGASWSASNMGLMDLDVRAIAVPGPNVFVGTNVGIFCSTDEGASWTRASSGQTDTTITCLAVNGTNLLAGTYGGVFLSTNNGATWNHADVGLPTFPVNSIAVCGPNIFVSTYGGVFRSTDSGGNWNPADSGLPADRDIACLVACGKNLFAGTGGDGVYLSEDFGASWTPIIGGLADRVVRSLAASDTEIIAGTDSGGVFLTTNNGTSWTAANSGLTNRHVTSLYVHDTHLLAGTNCGVFRSTDRGSNWVPARTSGYANWFVTALAVQGAELFAGARVYRFWVVGGPHVLSAAYILHSTDNGEYWTPEISIEASAFAILDSSIFAGTTQQGVFRSTDHGAHWKKVNEGISKLSYDTTRYISITCFASLGQELYAGTAGGIFRSTNDGQAWSAVGASWTNADWRNECLCLAVSETNILAGTYAGVFVSTDHGDSWSPSSSGLPLSGEPLSPPSINCFARFGMNLLAGTMDAGVFSSTDNGHSWNACNSGLPYSPSITCMASDGEGLFAGGYGLLSSGYQDDGDVFLFANDSKSWTAVNSGLDSVLPLGWVSAFGSLRSLGLNSTYVFLGTGWRTEASANGKGIWRRPLSEMLTAVQSRQREVPRTYELSQNYPNPFNPTTEIRYQVPAVSTVELVIFDILGREVVTMLNEVKQPGTYTARWDASGMASGVYFCQLKARQMVNGHAGTFIETKKLLLLQ